MKGQEEVAIIGASFKLPGCENWNELLNCLRSASDCVGPIPERRLQELGTHRKGNEKEAGWLEDISSFDYRKFAISYSEAQLIDPRQRQSLQLVYSAILDAGYSLESFSSSRTAVLTSAAGGPHTDFYSILTSSDKLDPQAFTGNLHALSAGRIAYYFNFIGPAFTVDTGCSSFLTALHQACSGLRAAEYETAIVGGFELVVGELPIKAPGNGGLGVESSTDRSRPFDSESDGTGFGEGGGFVILKRKCDAERDGDNILATICGSAINHDGARCNGITSPSAQAQSDVINLALQSANLKPQQVSYIEAHGTGTKIGDPIEIEGLLNSHLTDRPNGEHCYVSSTKSNFGHLGGMAGFVGLIRVLAQFRVKELFPTVHFKSLNPLADENFTQKFSICNEHQPWLAVDGEWIAGISSFGLSGTNVHCILKAPKALNNSKVDENDEKMFVLSDDSEQGLDTLKQRLLSTLQNDSLSLFDISSTLLAGREHLKYRWSYIADTQAKLIAALQLVQKPDLCSPSKVVLCLDRATPVDVTTIAKLRDKFSVIAQFIKDHDIDIDALTIMQRQLLWMLANQALIQSLKLQINTVLTTGLGKLVNAVNSQNMTIAEAFVASNEYLTDDSVDKDRLQAFLNSVPDATFISMDINSRLAQLLKAEGAIIHEVSKLEALLLEQFNSGEELNWAALAVKQFNRLALPYPELIKRDCWPSMTNFAHQHGPLTLVNEAPTVTDTSDKYQKVLSIVCCVLKDDSICIDDDFFEIGGNSLNGIKVIDGVNKVFGSDLTLEDLLYSDDLASLADLLYEPVTQGAIDSMLTDINNIIQLTGQQEMIWAASELQDIEGTYYVPAAMISDQQIDHQWLTQLMNDLVNSQIALRARITHGENGIQMSTVNPFEVKIAKTSLDFSECDFTAGKVRLEQYLQQKMTQKLDIYSVPNFSVQLFDVNFSDGCRSAMLFVFHHLFFDGWSWKVVFEALIQGQAPVPLRCLSTYIREQVSKAEKVSYFWSEYLHGFSQPSIQLSYADHVKDGELNSDYALSGDYIAFEIDSVLSASVTQFAKSHRVTNYNVLLSTWILFHWYKTGQRKICIAIPVANRKPEDELTIGCFINTVVGAYDIDASLTVEQVIKTVSSSTIKAVSNAAYPTNKIYKCGALQSDSLVMFDYQFDFSERFQLAQGQTVELLDVVPTGAKHPFNVTCVESGGAIQVRFEYSSQWFSKEIIRTFVDEFLVLLMDVVSAQPDTEIVTLFNERSTQCLGADDPQFDF